MASGPVGARLQVFVRQSSGLIREFSLLDVVIINVVGVNAPFGIILTLAAVTSIWPQVDLTWLTIFGGIASAATVITYGLMSAAMPRSGGDYVFVGRSLWPWFGFAANWMMTFSLFVLFGLFAVSIATLAIGPSLTALGYVIGNSTAVSWANQVETDKATIAVLAFLSVLACIGIALMGDRWVRQTFRVLTIVGRVGAILALVVLAMNDHGQFVGRMNTGLSAHQLNTIQQMQAAAARAGFHASPFSLGTTLQALPYGFFLFVGLTYTTYLGGEIQRPQRSQPLGMAITLIVTAVYYLLFAGIGAVAFPYSRPDLFNRALEITRRRFLGIPWITIAGVAETIIFIWIIIASTKLPAISGPVGGTSLTIIFGMLIAGPVVFFVSRQVRKSQGIDMDAAWTTLPPD